MDRRELLLASGTVLTAGLAGCTGGDSNGDDGGGDDGGGDSGGNGETGDDGGGGESSGETGDGGGDGESNGDGDDGSGGNGDDGDGESGTGGDAGSGGGADGPRAAVETYVQAGQDGDSEAMSAIVHPDGTAPTSPDAGGGSMGDISVNSITVADESDAQASVVVAFEMTQSQDGEERTVSFETTYQVRTHEGGWYVYSRSGGI